MSINRSLHRIAQEGVIQTLENKDKEIERLKENNQAMQEEMARTWKKLDEKENIIEEARKYIEDACWLDEVNKPNSLGHKQTIKLLEILNGSDKE